MPLEQLDIVHVRNIAQAGLPLSPALNLVVGGNASGKTSVLEAIHFLSYGRSFRPGSARQLVARGATALMVAASVRDADGLAHRLGLRLADGDKEMRVNGRAAESQAELSRLLPVVAVQPSAQILLESSPDLRRQFLDWTVFQSEDNFLPVWRRYQKALEQRNRLLRTRTPGALSAWDHELALYGEQLGTLRRRVLIRLEAETREVAALFWPMPDLALDFRQGWREDQSLEDALRGGLARDLNLGYTVDGPHRADFVVTVAGQPVRHFLSRGQMKLLVVALKLAQARRVRVARGERVTVLLDDLAAELDDQNRDALLTALEADDGLQIILTGTDLGAFRALRPANSAIFRLERGTITLQTT